MARLTALFAALTLPLILTGCIGIGVEKDVHHKPTTGQRLIDLDNAWKQGAITDEEYKELKRDILSDAKSSRRR